MAECSIMGSGGCCADYKQAVAERVCSEAKIKNNGLLGDNKRINNSRN